MYLATLHSWLSELKNVKKIITGFFLRFPRFSVETSFFFLLSSQEVRSQKEALSHTRSSRGAFIWSLFGLHAFLRHKNSWKHFFHRRPFMTPTSTECVVPEKDNLKWTVLHPRLHPRSITQTWLRRKGVDLVWEVRRYRKEGRKEGRKRSIFCLYLKNINEDVVGYHASHHNGITPNRITTNKQLDK